MMNATVKEYLHVILQQRDWSWTLVAIAYFSVGLILRGFFLRSIQVRAKTLPKKQYHRLKQIYLGHSILGWIFFILPLVIAINLWNKETLLPLARRDIAMIGAAGLAFILSLMSHLAAIGIAAIETVRKLTESQADA